MSIEAVDAFEAVRDVIGIVQPLARARSIAIHLRDSDVPTFVLADGQRLRQVLLNLLSNAIKYNFEAGAVTVFIDRNGDHLRFNVVDTGPGISREQAEQLFIPFQRLGAEATAVEGTGLGLALSLRLTEAMGGNVGLEPSPSGAHFVLDLVATECPSSTLHALDDGALPQPLLPDHSLSVLLVEDNSANVRLIEKCLAHFKNATLRVAMTGTTGYEAAVAEPPDLVLLDLNLPDVHGLEVLRALRSDPRTAQVPVVVTSADASPSQISRLFEAGAADYLTKPVDLQALWRTIERCKPGGLEKSA
jgi:CheY-like chemotaxis protein